MNNCKGCKLTTVYKGCAFYIINSYYAKLCPCQLCLVKIVCYTDRCIEFDIFNFTYAREEAIFRAENINPMKDITNGIL